ncbi:MAG: solute carrier family 26 protein [Myxococcales bacterium]|nr:solute carrier family 26 protein [Myxococcales bacterium]
MASSRRSMPLASWVMHRPRREDLRGDLVAGLTTAVMLIPQAMAYAMLAGLPPIVGLYASTVPLVVYALLGSSRQLAVGPVAMDSLLVATGVGALALPGTDAYLGMAVALAAMVGVIQVVMGLLRAGFLVNFLSRPVVSGFTSAAALIISTSQLGQLLGIPLDRGSVLDIVGQAVTHLHQVQPATLAIGAGSVLLLLALRRWAPRVPAALAVVLVGTLVVWGLSLHEHGVAIVGAVPAGLPPLTLPPLDASTLQELWPIALTISLVAFLEAISVGKSMASRNGYEIDADRELRSLGLANLAGSFFGAYPVTGGLSRTAVNAQAGARTSMAGLVTAIVVALTLALLTPLFHFLPKAVLAAIIVVAVLGLVDLAEVRHLWHVERSELGLLLLTFAATLGLGVQEGIAVGVGASLVWHVARTTRPHTAVLGRLPDTEVYRNVLRFPNAATTPGVVVLRIDAQLFFGNVTFLKQTLRGLVDGAATPVHTVVLDATAINRLDSSADEALHELHRWLHERGVTLRLSGIKGPVRDMMRRTGLWSRVGADHIHFTVHEAVEAATTGGATAEAWSGA